MIPISPGRWTTRSTVLLTGASPIREALSRLSSEGLVVRTELRGFSVAPLNWDELPTLTQNRIELESLTLRASIEQRDQEMEEELVLIEVQVGDYLGEDDIVRLQDNYGRA